MADSMVAQQVMSGTEGEVWIDSDYMAQVTAFQAEVNLVKEEVNQVKKRVQDNRMGRERQNQDEPHLFLHD